MSFDENKPATIHDLATAAGVSVSTASKALAGKGRMSADTRARIGETAARLGYRPNRAAQSLSRRTLRVAALLPQYPMQVQSVLSRGLHDAFREQSDFNIKWTVYEYPITPGGEHELRFLRENCDDLDGVIVETACPLGSVITAAEERRGGSIPMVSLVSAPSSPESDCTVSVDAEAAGRVAAQFLGIVGSKRALVFAGERNVPIHERNIRGFTDYKGTAAPELLDVYYTNDMFELASEQTAQALERYPDADGIFVTSYLAPAVCRVVEKAGKKGSIHIIGVDIYDLTEQCLRDGSLDAAIYQNQYLQGRTAVDALVGILGHNRTVPPLISFKPELVLTSNVSCYLNNGNRIII